MTVVSHVGQHDRGYGRHEYWYACFPHG